MVKTEKKFWYIDVFSGVKYITVIETIRNK